MKKIIYGLTGCLMLVAIISYAQKSEIKVVQTSSDEFVGAMNPPTDRVLVYFSDFEIIFPKSAQFESYSDQENLKAVWMTINSTDLPEFLKSNNLDIGATNITPRSEHSLPISNTMFPNEKWKADYIIQPGNPTAYIRIGISLESNPARETKSKAYLSDAKQWATNGVMIVN